MKSEMKMPRDREREVKFLENSREILENPEILKILNACAFHLVNFYSTPWRKVKEVQSV